MTPKGLSNSFLTSIIRSSPELIYLILGRRSLIPSVTFYTEVFSPRFFSYLIDRSVKLLFDWNSSNMSAHTKMNAYQHLYSTSSVKAMLHWFQIIQNRRFAMFDEEISKVIKHWSAGIDEVGQDNWENMHGSEEQLVLSEKQPLMMMPKRRIPLVTHLTPRYPTQQISNVPIAVFYGGSDTLLDMKQLLKGLNESQLTAPMPFAMEPPKIIVDRLAGYKHDASSLVFMKCIPAYEHICLLWADDAHQHVHPDIFRILDHFNKIGSIVPA